MMYNIIHDALNNKNNNVTYEYEIEDDNLVLCVDVDMAYYKDVLQKYLKNIFS